jgi:hypothetical protein
VQPETQISAASARVDDSSRRNSSRTWLTGVGVLLAIFYAAVVFKTAHRHEPWADEAQSWLIARNASLVEIWTKLVRLEGSPGLWHSLLHGLILLRLPYSGLNYVSGALGLAAGAVVFCFAPFPVVIRAALPFTYFLCFQYAVIARNYSLAPLLLFSAAAAFRANRNRLLLVLLILLALVSAQAFLLSLAFAATITFRIGRRWRFTDEATRRNVAKAALVYAAALLLIALAVWPDRHTVFFISPNWAPDNFLTMSRYAFTQAFGDSYWPIVLIALSVPALSKGPGLLFLSLSFVSVCTLDAVVYSNVWHHGYLVLAWLAALWLSYRRDRRNLLAVGALVLFISLQCGWTWNAVRYDRRNPYSGSRAMAALLKTQLPQKPKVFGIGFSTVAVQPYFPASIFANYSGGRNGHAFWTWSRESTTNDAAERLGTDHPDLVVVGCPSDSDRKVWTYLITESGYKQIAETKGDLFWRTGPFQPENFQLFAPGPKTSDTVLLSHLNLRESKGDVQLLSGFTGPPNGEGRPIEPGGSVFLQRPSLEPGGEKARFEMTFAISKDQFERTGPMSLTVYVSGFRMNTMKIPTAGDYRYSAEVTRDKLFWAVVAIAFQFKQARLFAPALPASPVATASHIGFFVQ